MATHSSILAWRIPWTEELGGLQSTGRKELDTTERLHFHFRCCFLGGTSGKEPSCQCRKQETWGSISQTGRSPGEGNGNPLQYSCLETPMDGGAWWATVHGSHSRTRLRDFTFTFTIILPCCVVIITHHYLNLSYKSIYVCVYIS